MAVDKDKIQRGNHEPDERNRTHHQEERDELDANSAANNQVGRVADQCRCATDIAADDGGKDEGNRRNRECARQTDCHGRDQHHDGEVGQQSTGQCGNAENQKQRNSRVTAGDIGG